MSLYAGQEKKLLRGQIIMANVTLERVHGVGNLNVAIRALLPAGSEGLDESSR